MPDRRTRGSVLATALVISIAALLMVGVGWFFTCPCEQLPGGYLLGERASEPVTDWSFVNDDVELCQIQVQRGILPHSINLNCMSAGGELFLSCARCDGKSWSTAALHSPAARLRLNDTVYPVTVVRVEDPARLDAAWRARAEKLDQPADRPRQDGWWSFHVVSR